MGRKVVSVAPESLTIESLKALVATHRPRAFVGINHSPEVAWVVSREGVPYVSWTVDPLPLDRLRVLAGTVTDLVTVFLHRSSQVDLFRSLGFPRVEWLPLAAPRQRFVERPERERLPPSFVGSSLRDEIRLFQDAALRWGLSPFERDALTSSLEALADLALENFDFAGFPIGGQGLPESLLKLATEDPPFVAEAVNAWISARMRRRQVADLCARGLDVFGDEGWADLAGSRWRGPLADGQDLTRVYAASLANLDVPRIHQRDIATLRAFDVAAAGGCLLAEPSRDLAALFEPGIDFISYVNRAELHVALDEIAHDPERSRIIGRNARERALADHALETRARQILSAI